MIYTVYRDVVIPDSNVCKRLARFRSGQFYEENQESSDRRAIVDGYKSKILFKTNPGHTTQDIVDVLHISHISVERHLETHA